MASKVKMNLGVAAMVLGVTALVTFHQPDFRVKVLDPRMRVLSAKILRGPNDSFYVGNQLEGRVRDFLKERMHLKVARLSNVGRTSFPSRNTHRFALLFDWDAAEAPPKYFVAELVHGSTSVTQLSTSSVAGRDGTNPRAIDCLLEDLPSGSESYCLKLRATETNADGRLIPGAVLAEVEIRKLPALLPKR